MKTIDFYKTTVLDFEAAIDRFNEAFGATIFEHLDISSEKEKLLTVSASMSRTNLNSIEEFKIDIGVQTAKALVHELSVAVMNDNILCHATDEFSSTLTLKNLSSFKGTAVVNSQTASVIRNYPEYEHQKETLSISLMSPLYYVGDFGNARIVVAPGMAWADRTVFTVKGTLGLGIVKIIADRTPKDKDNFLPEIVLATNNKLAVVSAKSDFGSI